MINYNYKYNDFRTKSFENAFFEESVRSAELQDELGLDMYTMDMRHYDPAIARWVVHDPITHFYQSPYSAFDGNPVFWADPSGGSVSESVFENLGGTQTGSFTDMATGTSIGAGGAGDNKQNPHKSNASQKNISSNNYSFSDIVWEEGDSNAVELEEVVITDMNQLEKALEDRIVNQAYPIWSNQYSSTIPNWIGRVNDGVGGFGTGVQRAGGTFRVTKGNKISPKLYESGWKGGSRAQIKTYSSLKYGKIIGKGSVVGTVVLGSISIHNGYQQDGGTFGQNTAVASGGAVGGGLGAWGGAKAGAIMGGSIGSVIPGLGTGVGVIVGGVIGGIAGGYIGTEIGEGAVNSAY